MATDRNIPQHFQIAETEGWLVSHRVNSALPGYVMISSKIFTVDLCELSSNALSELGPLLAKAQNALKCVLCAERVYIGRYGHTPGYPIHFHVIPVYGWVEELFWNDSRYRILETFADGPGETATDGAETTLFVWRKFCERAEPPQIKGPSVAQAVELLREAIQVPRNFDA
jgi:diadenosine tetraphosphate (Ap4A) HIT family hydrolase